MNAVVKLLKSFVYALRGIWYCIKTCRNFRIHTAVTVLVLFFSRFYNFSAEKYAILFITFGLVLSFECINSSLENICDAVTMEYSMLIKQAKDVAAGAVLCSAIVSVAVAFFLFWDNVGLKRIYTYFCSVSNILILLSALILLFIYIFYEDIFKNGKK